jgi:cysteine desulfurase
MADLEQKLAAGPEKTLVTLMHANNEIGNMLDLFAVGELCKRFGAVFHSDTVQTVGHFPFDLRNTPVHFITGAGHKFHGPKGVGILYINENVKINPYIHGGSQERNMRAGTENLYGIIGFAKALELATSGYEKDSAYIKGVKVYMMEQLKKHIPGVEQGSHVIRAINNNPNQVTVRFSFSRHNTNEEVDTVVAKLKELI